MTAAQMRFPVINAVSADFFTNIDYDALAEQAGVVADVVKWAITRPHSIEFDMQEEGAVPDEDLGNVTINELDMGLWDRGSLITLADLVGFILTEEDRVGPTYGSGASRE